MRAIGNARGKFPVAIAKGQHPFPSRTRQLSPSAPMVLWPTASRESRTRPGNLRAESSDSAFFFKSSIAPDDYLLELFFRAGYRSVHRQYPRSAITSARQFPVGSSRAAGHSEMKWITALVALLSAVWAGCAHTILPDVAIKPAKVGVACLPLTIAVVGDPADTYHKSLGFL